MIKPSATNSSTSVVIQIVKRSDDGAGELPVGEFYRCLTRRADAVFELTDAVLCADRHPG